LTQIYLLNIILSGKLEAVLHLHLLCYCCDVLGWRTTNL